jgi:hypothetical protein
MLDALSPAAAAKTPDASDSKAWHEWQQVTLSLYHADFGSLITKCCFYGRGGARQ